MCQDDRTRDHIFVNEKVIWVRFWDLQFDGNELCSICRATVLDGNGVGTMAKIELNGTVEREIGKAGILSIDFDKLPQASLDYIFAYGLKQVLADAHSSAKTLEEAKALSEKKLAALYEGTIRASSGRTSDPVLAEAKRLAKAALEKALKEAGKKATPEAMKEAVIKLMPRWMDEARANVRAAKQAAGGLDLTGLGL